MSEDRKKELERIAFSFQYVSNSYIFENNYSNEEIEFLLSETERLTEINLQNGITV